MAIICDTNHCVRAGFAFLRCCWLIYSDTLEAVWLFNQHFELNQLQLQSPAVQLKALFYQAAKLDSALGPILCPSNQSPHKDIHVCLMTSKQLQKALQMNAKPLIKVWTDKYEVIPKKKNTSIYGIVKGK